MEHRIENWQNLSGRDLAVHRIASEAYYSELEKTNNIVKANAAYYRMRNRAEEIHSRVDAPHILPTEYKETSSVVNKLTPAQTAAKQYQYAYNTILGVNRRMPYSAESAAMAFTDPMFEERQAEVMAPRAAAEFRSMMDRERMRREHITKFAPKKSSDAQNQKQIKTIEKGVQKAFGGKSLGMLRDVFGYGFGYGHIARAVVNTAAAHSHGAQATFLSGLGVGVDAKTMRGLENAAEMLGGSKGDAAQFAKNITHFLYGSKMGLGFGPLQNLHKYGIKLHTGMSREEMMWNIAEGYSRLTKEDRGAFAAENIVPTAFISAMGEGGNKFLEALEKGKGYVPENIDDLRENSLALRELGVSWNRFVDTSIPALTSSIHLLTSAVNLATDAVNKTKEGKEFASDVVDFFTGEEGGRYNVVSDYFHNIFNAQSTKSVYGVGGVLASSLVPSGVGMMAAAPEGRSVENNVTINAPGASSEFSEMLKQAVQDATDKYYGRQADDIVIYASQGF